MKTKKLKIFLLLFFIIILITLAVPNSYSMVLDRNSIDANLIKTSLREGGTESGNLLTEEEQLLYDDNKYSYQDVRKIIDASSGIDFSNAIYSLDLNNDSLNTDTNPTSYSNLGLFDETDLNTKTLYLRTSFADDSMYWNMNYSSLLWLFNNFYLRNQTPEQKESFLQTFSNYIYERLELYGLDVNSEEELYDLIKTSLTDDDIDVVQQCAVWYYTNDEEYNNYIDYIRNFVGSTVTDENGIEIELSDIRGNLMNGLYDYYVENSDGVMLEDIIYPEIKNHETNKAVVEEGFYVAGPFEVSSGINATNYQLKLVDENGNELNRSDYIIKSFGLETNRDIDEIFDEQYYVYIPTSKNISEVKLVLEYNKYETIPTLWKSTITSDENIYEPVVLINRTGNNVIEEQVYEIDKIGKYNLKIINKDSNGNQLANTEFSIAIGYNEEIVEETNENGIILLEDLNIENIDKEEVVISETNLTAENCEILTENIKFNINKAIESGQMKITDIEEVSELPEVTIEFDLENQLITITVVNNFAISLENNYDIKIINEDKDDGTKIQGAEFNILCNGNLLETYANSGNTTFTTDINGMIQIPTITILENGIDNILIREINPSSNYLLMDEDIEIEITKDNLSISNINPSVSSNGNYEVTMEEALITVTVKNTKVQTLEDGTYNLEIIKQDKDTLEKLEGVEFSIKINGTEISNTNGLNTFSTNSEGIVEIPTRTINNLNNDIIVIEEVSAKEGYKEILPISLTVTKEIYNNTYKVSNVTGTGATLNNDKITVVIDNERIVGSYDLEIQNIDKNGNIILADEATYGIKVKANEEEEKETENGKIEYGTINIEERSSKDNIVIREKEAPEGYNALIESVTIKVTKDVVEGNYKATNVEVEGENVEAQIEGNKIIVKVKNEKILGSYNLEITKVDSKDENEKLSNVTFNAKFEDNTEKTITTDEDGIISIQNLSIKKVGKEEIIITETNTKEGYELLEEPIILELNEEQVGEEYIVTDVIIKSNDEMSEVSIEDKTIKLKVLNKKIILGSYDLIIEKDDEDNNIILEPVTFEINDEAKLTENGTINFANIEINKYNVNEVDNYKIKEISAPENYTKFENSIYLNISKKLSDDGTKYLVDNIELLILDENEEQVISDDVTYEIQQVEGKQVIKLNIKNYADVDLSLSNNLVAISKDEIFEEDEFLTINNSKEEIEVEKGDYLLYRIKVYNEGKSNAKATKIINYLSKGIDFVSGLERNNIWNYDEENRILQTNENYNAKLLNKHIDGQDDDYQEIEIICKISDNATEDIIIESIAEIAEITYRNGKIARDIDSIVNSCNINKDEDDTDVEKIIVIDYSKVDLALRVFIAGVSNDEIINEEDMLTGEDSREPIVDKEKLDSLEEKTAQYNQPKNVLTVRENDYILYKIRVYNEGNIKAQASEVQAYIPKGLEFIEDLTQNEIWDYDEESNTVKTNENYIQKILERHTKENDLDYQDIELVLKVKDDVEEDINLVLISEITEYKNEVGEIIIDRDSEVNNFDYPDDISNYSGTPVTNNYISGQEDEDDFEIVMVKALFGEYDFEIENIDQEGNVIKDYISEFSVNDENRNTENGIIAYKQVGISKQNIKNVDVYKIRVINVQEEFSKFEGLVEIEIPKKISDDETQYEVDKENVSLTVKDKDGNVISNSKDVNLIIDENENRTKIKVRIRNYEHIDLALRKYVAAISKNDPIFEESEYLTGIESRIPEVQLNNLDEGKAKTATYNDRKDAIEVKRFNYILYKIRVYNEGNQNGIASKIADYIPEELEFVKTAKENEIWDYDENTRIATTNEKYVPKIINKHTKGTNLDYQEISIICRVKDEIEENTNIANIAEIAEYKYEDETIAIDRDSIAGNFNYPSNVSNYFEGQEDDDNLDRIIVRPNTGIYDIEIIKTDNFGNIINNGNTIFSINGQDIYAKDGKAVFTGISITKENLNLIDNFEIIEVEAPTGYIRYTGNINLAVEKKESDDKSKLEIKSVSMELVNAYGKHSNSNDFELIHGEERDKIIIKIQNEKSSNEDISGSSTLIPSDYKNTILPSSSTINETTGNNSYIIVPKTNSNTNNNNVSLQAMTGDTIPKIIANIIFIVIGVNLIQVSISKLLKKNKNNNDNKEE